MAKTLPRLQANVDQTLFVIFDDTDEVGNLELDIQGAPKKMSHSDFKLKSVPEVRLYFFTCVSESEFRARSI